MWLWAWNPSLDDPKTPIALRNVSGAGPETGENTTSGISWNLDSTTTDDLHAVIIGVSRYKRTNCGLDDIPHCTENARKFETYLKDTLQVPFSQVVTLLDADATKDRILDEIKALEDKELLVGNAPVVVYISTYTYIGCSSYFLPYITEPVAGGANLDGLSVCYFEIEKLLEGISKKKTDNIVFIMDCCLAGFHGLPPTLSANGRGKMFVAPTFAKAPFAALWADGQVTQEMDANSTMLLATIACHPGQEYFYEHHLGFPLPDSASHAIIAASRSRLATDPEAGKLGLLTVSLLDVLTRSPSLRTMTYDTLMEEVLERMDPDSPKRHPLTNSATVRGQARQFPFWTRTFQNRLLFDGLFARRLERDSSSAVITVCYTDR